MVKYLTSLNADLSPAYFESCLNAVKNDNIEMVKYFDSLDDSLVKEHGELIAQASFKLNFEIVCFLAEKYPDCTLNFNLALINACNKGSLSMATLLISYGASPICNNNEPILQAILSDRFELVHHLLSVGATIPHLFNEICLKGSQEMVIYLLRLKNIDLFESDRLLKSAAIQGYLEVIKEIVSREDQGKLRLSNALKYAAKHGKIPCIKYILSLGIDCTLNNNIVIARAARYGTLDTIQLLLSHGGCPKVAEEYFNPIYILDNSEVRHKNAPNHITPDMGFLLPKIFPRYFLETQITPMDYLANCPEWQKIYVLPFLGR